MNQQKRPEPPVLKRAGFTLRNGVFDVENQPRLEEPRLLELYFPESLRLKRDQKRAAEDAQKLFKKAFFAAQLRYYGIKFPPNANVAALKVLLKDSVQAGKCRTVHPDVVELERNMRKDYERTRQAYVEELARWSEADKQRRDAEFNQRSTPGERAAYDMQRFLDHYFLTDGRPDPTKTTEPLALHGFDDSSQMHSHASRIPGLETISGRVGKKRVVFVGWDRAEVSRLAARLNDEAVREHEAEKKLEWAATMAEHRRLVKDVKKGGGLTPNRKSATPPVLQYCLGSYVVRCAYVEEEWPSDRALTLDIAFGPRPNVLQAAVDMNVMKGTMLLALSDEVLDEIIGHAESSGEEDEYEEDEDDDGEDEEDEDDDVKPSKRRARAKKRGPGPPSKKVKPTAPHGRPTKKAKAVATPQRRVFFGLRGRETGEGEIFHEPVRGYLEFTDDGYTAFESVVDIPLIGSGIKFEGLKIARRPLRVAEPWSNFSERMREWANRSRWG